MLLKTVNNKNVAIVGATGYGGIQSIKILSEISNYNISYICGNKTVGKKWNDLFPTLHIDSNPIISEIDIDRISQTSDYVILALPNGLSSSITPNLLNKGLKVIDLSADYRFNSLDKWKSVYALESKKFERNDYELCLEAIYGLPELNTNAIKKARLVACPGCFPTASLIGLIPFLIQGFIDDEGIVIDAKTGTSGGGRDPKVNLLFSEIDESISPYSVIGHRHTPEIEEISSKLYGKNIELQFTPHLVPMIRGILSTVYGRLRDPGLTSNDCRVLLINFYKDFPNIVVLPQGTYPKSKWASKTNNTYLSVEVDSRTGRIVIMSAIDNLLKGQSGQAIQNLNLMSGNPLNNGLKYVNFYP